MEKLEEKMEGLSLRSDKLEETLRSWTPHGRSYTGGGTPVIRERANREKRWSMESITSLASATHEGGHLGNNHHKPFLWQMPFTVKCIGTFKLVIIRKPSRQRLSLTLFLSPEVIKEPSGHCWLTPTGCSAAVVTVPSRCGT